MQPSTPTVQCEVCGARVNTLRRGRCWICYVRWAESRPVGTGAACTVCNDRRRENLRLVEYLGSWVPMCHNCATKSFRLSPMPQSIEALRERLNRDRRWQDRRRGEVDHRMIRKERRVGERRVLKDQRGADWLDADDLIIEILDLPEEGGSVAEATRISPAALEDRGNSSAP